MSFQTLEPRHLLAGISLNSGTGEVTIAGTSAADTATFVQVNSSTVRATLNGFANQEFSATAVNAVVFIGIGGNDTFTNSTAKVSRQYGGDGDDTLNGGSAADKIIGGKGNDQIRGNNGNDRLVGGSGNDNMLGGNGNDSMFGSAGVNVMQGEAGDDLMFGGNAVDTMSGGQGIDQIFSLGGNDILNSGDGGVAGTSGITEADLVLGGAGDDTISGGNGLNVFYGGDGNDTLVGGSGENRLHGQYGNDSLTGGAANDYLAAQLGDDTINGLGGNDYIIPGFGNDTVNAGPGNDFVVFSSTFSNYQIFGLNSPFTVIDTRGVDGTDTIKAAESFRFTDGDRRAVSQISRIVYVQPIIASNSNGTNTAEFFGNATEQAEILSLIDQIFYAAGVDINWLSTRNYNNNFANVGNGGVRPPSDLGTVISQGDSNGVGHTNTRVLDMYFVEIAAGFGQQGDNFANGLGFVDGGGITIHIGDNLPTFQNGRKVVARVAAHEIAHNLGLDHVSTSGNLMANGIALSASQIGTIRNSQFAVSF